MGKHSGGKSLSNQHILRSMILWSWDEVGRYRAATEPLERQCRLLACAVARRRFPRRKMKTKGVLQIARSKEAGRDAFCPLEDAPRLRASAAQGPFRRTRRVPPRRHRAKPQDHGAPVTRAQTDVRVSGLRVKRHQLSAYSRRRSTPLKTMIGTAKGHQLPAKTTFSTASAKTCHRCTSPVAPPRANLAVSPGRHLCRPICR